MMQLFGQDARAAPAGSAWRAAASALPVGAAVKICERANFCDCGSSGSRLNDFNVCDLIGRHYFLEVALPSRIILRIVSLALYCASLEGEAKPFATSLL
jgi:hypothetical protein